MINDSVKLSVESLAFNMYKMWVNSAQCISGTVTGTRTEWACSSV